MKQLWVKVDPWDKKLVTTALESGADALWVPQGRTEAVKALGLITVVAPDGDLVPGQDVQEVAITSTADEAEVIRLARQGPVVVHTPDWSIIPLENLVAQTHNIFVEVSDEDAARTALGVLEKGVDGLVVTDATPAMIKKIARLVKDASMPVTLTTARITYLKPLGMGDRVCVDTCSNLGLGEGMLVGNSSGGLFLVHAESLENPYVAPRPSGSTPDPCTPISGSPGTKPGTWGNWRPGTKSWWLITRGAPPRRWWAGSRWSAAP